MRNTILAMAAIAGAIGTPIAAQAQAEITTGVVRGAPVVVDQGYVDQGYVDPGPGYVRQGYVGQGYVDRGYVDDGYTGIAVDQRPAFRQYVIRERVPNYLIPDQVVVGGVLPESGVTYYQVPQTYGATPYRYTVVNGQTVLVEPRSRRIVQVID